MNSELKIGIALGSGAARGMSHIGIINALAIMGIEPAIICGTSVGSLVGASYAAGKLEKLESWARSLTRLDVARFIDINTSFTGFVDTDRLHDFLNEHVASDDAVIEDLPKAYASVATDLANGREVWLNEGSIIQSVWASMSLPGLFPAIKHKNSWLVDGGLVNPVPVSTCRAMGADIVIADICEEMNTLPYKLSTPETMAEAVEIIRLIPDTPVILNHSGFPWDRSAEGMALWRRAMRLVAAERLLDGREAREGHPVEHDKRPKHQHGGGCEHLSLHRCSPLVGAGD